MAAPTFIINSPIQVRLPVVPELETDEDTFREILRIYTAINDLLAGVTKYTGAGPEDPSTWSLQTPDNTIFAQNLNRLYVKASEAIIYGAPVNFFDSGGGVLGVRNANGVSPTLRGCHGFCNTVAGVTAGNYCETICGIGLNAGVTGLTIGTVYYLAASSGAYTSTKPVAPNLVQPIGFALTATLLYHIPYLGF